MYAIWAGQIAGDVIAKASQENNFSKDRLMEYDNRWRNAFEKRLMTGLKAKEFLSKLSDNDLNTLAHSLVGVNLAEFTTTALLMELVKKNPKLLFGLAKMLL